MIQSRPLADTGQAPAERFTGDVYRTAVFDGDGTSHLVVGHVRFTPGARTNWHSHAHGQLLVCTEGAGVVVGRDGTVARLRAGDAVWTPAGEEHWHGSEPDRFMAHYAILDGTETGDGTTWLEPVTDAQYAVARTGR